MMRALVLCSIHACATAITIASLEQGSAFTQCISITDFQTKTADDDITLQDRDANGCCPVDTVAGIKLFPVYWGAQVVCGVQANGKPKAPSKSGSNPRTCTYESCYVMKIADKIKCVDDAKPLINGCCGATKGSRTFTADCLFYDKTGSAPVATGNNAQPEYCTSYHKKWGTTGYGYDGTADSADDVADSKFQIDKFYAYANCAKGSGSTGSTGSGTTGVADSSSSISSAALGAATLASVAFVFASLI